MHSAIHRSFAIMFLVTFAFNGAGCQRIDEKSREAQTTSTGSEAVATSTTPSFAAPIPARLLPVDQTAYHRQTLPGSTFSFEIPNGWILETVTTSTAREEALEYQNDAYEQFLSTSTHGIPTHLWRLRYLTSEQNRVTGDFMPSFIQVYSFTATIDPSFFNSPKDTSTDNELPLPTPPINQAFRDAFGIDEHMGGVSGLWYKPHNPAYFKGDPLKYYDILYFGGGGIGPDLKNLSAQISHLISTLRR